MSDDRCAVHRLRLRAADAVQARQAGRLLEDALRCASLSTAVGAPGRLLLVRRLALGTLPAQASSQAVALHCERRLGAVASSLQRHGASADAGAAPLVWFRDALDAHVALGLRLADGSPPTDWYWRLAVPGFDPACGAAGGLRLLLASLAALPEAPVAVPAWVCAFADAGRLGELAAALDERALPALRVASRLDVRSGPGASVPRRLAGPAAETAPPAVCDFLAAALHRAGHTAATSAPRLGTGVPGPARVSSAASADDDAALPALDDAARSGAVEAFGPVRPAAPAARQSLPPGPHSRPDAAAGEPPAAVTVAPGRDATLPAPDAARYAGESGEGGAVAPVRLPPSVAPRAGTGALPAAAMPAAGVAGAPRAPGGSSATRGPVADPGHDGAAVARAAAPPAPATPTLPTGSVPGDAAARETRAGGLLLLVRVLDRMSYAGWAVEHWPDDPGDVARRLFALLLGRLGVPPDDAAWQLTDSGRATVAVTASGEASAPPETAPGDALPQLADSRLLLRTPSLADARADAAWHSLDRRRDALGGRRPLPRPRHGLPAADAWAAVWLALVRRWLRRLAGIGPATLVLRSAWLAQTPTHADVRAGPQAIDVRIRRAGLDIDPGWVPWLGRVVAFHYDARHDSLGDRA